MDSSSKFSSRRAFLGGAASFVSLFPALGGARAAAAAVAQGSAFMQGVAEAAARDRALAAFYKANGYQAIWTGRSAAGRARRNALLKAVSAADDHGLPASAYDTQLLRANLRKVRSERDLGHVEVALSQLFLRYAQDVQSGVLTPSRVDREIARKAPRRDRLTTLTNFSKSSPGAYLRALPPATPEYTRLMKHKLAMEKVLARGGWGPKVPGRKIRPGDSGAQVVALRNRLIAMGFMRRSASATFDVNLQKAVQRFQLAHGLNPDGVAGAGTLKALNTSPERRLASIIVAMERERWLNFPRGERHIWVNLAAFTAEVIDNGKPTFRTRAVVGAAAEDRRSPEFSDEMEYMVINPTWNVPRSIAIKEYLPLMQKDPYAAGQLQVLDANGQDVDRASVDFTQYDETTFPFDLKQPPSRRNALGLVKFMFPNRFNIYLHDTPAKNLFGRDRRAYSHGCIRLRDPFEFAYTLLARQTRNPKQFFQAQLATGVEQIVELKRHVPVHLVYRTAFTSPRGEINFRGDIYGRDRRIFAALQNAGVELRAVRG